MVSSRFKDKKFVYFFCFFLFTLPVDGFTFYRVISDKEFFQKKFHTFCEKYLIQEFKKHLKGTDFFGPSAEDQAAAKKSKIKKQKIEKFEHARREWIAKWLMEHVNRNIKADEQLQAFGHPTKNKRSPTEAFILTATDQKRSDFYAEYKKFVEQEWKEEYKKNGQPIPSNVKEAFDGYTIDIMAEILNRLTSTPSCEKNMPKDASASFEKTQIAALPDTFFQKYPLIKKGISGY